MSHSIVIGPRIRKSPFFDATVKAGATHFTVYNHMYMPMSYGDPEGEYWQLVRGVSMWDVAAERQVQVSGPDSERLVRYLTPRSLGRCPVGRARYVPLCDHQGHIINDPVLLRVSADVFWLSIADSDMIYWVKAVAAEGRYDVDVIEPDVSPLAVQGPKAVDVIADLFGEQARSMKHFQFEASTLDGIPLVLCRSGWSRQGGFELFLMDAARGSELWERVAQAGKALNIAPGTPNVMERVESGLLSFTTDNELDSTPYEVGLGEYVHLEREDDFIGKDALGRVASEGAPRRRSGVYIDGPRVEGNEHPWPLLHGGAPAGTVRVATWSPRLERNVAIALVDEGVGHDADLQVETPEGKRSAALADLPFC